METKLQEVQRALEKAVASAGQQSLSAQRRHDAVEERARLAEQVWAAL